MGPATPRPCRRGTSLPWLVSLAMLAPACLPDEDWKSRGPTVPAPLDDGWEIAQPEDVDLDPALLADIHNDLLRHDRHFGTLSFLVVKRGKLVFETYLRSAGDRDRYNHVQSMTKSVTSLAFGIARDDGLFPDLQATLDELLPAAALAGSDPRVGTITLEQLLTMRSGIDLDNDFFSVELQVGRPRDPLRHILLKDLYADPGERFYYRDADPQVLGYVMQHRTGMTEQAFVRERIFEPLGIEDYYWESTSDGASLAAHGLHLRPRDIAKLGELALRCTLGDDASLVSTAWCQAATQVHVPTDETMAGDLDLGYGYYFWVLPDYDAFAAWGHGGQFFLVVPDQELVLVQTALPDTGELHGTRLEDFVELTAPLFCPECGR